MWTSHNKYKLSGEEPVSLLKLIIESEHGITYLISKKFIGTELELNDSIGNCEQKV